MPRTTLPGTLPSPGPVRRRSSLAHYVSSGSTTSIEDKFDKKLSAHIAQPSNFAIPKPSPRVPTELLDLIIALFTLSFCLPVPTRTTAFAHIKALTLVSKAFRHLILRHYFGILVLTNKSNIGLFRFLEIEDAIHRRCGLTGGFVWVRSVQTWLPIVSI